MEFNITCLFFSNRPITNWIALRKQFIIVRLYDLVRVSCLQRVANVTERSLHSSFFNRSLQQIFAKTCSFLGREAQKRSRAPCTNACIITYQDRRRIGFILMTTSCSSEGGPWWTSLYPPYTRPLAIVSTPDPMS